MSFNLSFCDTCDQQGETDHGHVCSESGTFTCEGCEIIRDAERAADYARWQRSSGGRIAQMYPNLQNDLREQAADPVGFHNRCKDGTA